MNKTYFIDIDGTILEEFEDGYWNHLQDARPLDGVVNALHTMQDNGDMIVLTTARSTDYEQDTLEQLKRLEIPYDKLVMGLNKDKRIIVNDTKDKEGSQERADHVSTVKNSGDWADWIFQL